MSYEVIKTIRGGRYRYVVESYRDPETGKVRSKWRYAGKAEGAAQPRRRRRAEQTRALLVDALERTLENTPWPDITVASVVREAGVAEATFYRYFHSLNDLLLASARQIFEEGDAALAQLADIAGTVDAERSRLRAWSSAVLSNPHGNAVLFALWVSGSSAVVRDERFERRRSAFLGYLRELAARGYVAVDDPTIDSLATALALLVQAFSYRAVIDRLSPDERGTAAIASMMERIVFV